MTDDIRYDVTALETLLCEQESVWIYANTKRGNNIYKIKVNERLKSLEDGFNVVFSSTADKFSFRSYLRFLERKFDNYEEYIPGRKDSTEDISNINEINKLRSDLRKELFKLIKKYLKLLRDEIPYEVRGDRQRIIWLHPEARTLGMLFAELYFKGWIQDLPSVQQCRAILDCFDIRTTAEDPAESFRSSFAKKPEEQRAMPEDAPNHIGSLEVKLSGAEQRFELEAFNERFDWPFTKILWN